MVSSWIDGGVVASAKWIRFEAVNRCLIFGSSCVRERKRGRQDHGDEGGARGNSGTARIYENEAHHD